MSYSVELWNRAGSQIADITKYASGLSINAGRNKAEAISFELDAYAFADYAERINTNVAQLLTKKVTEVRIKRNDTYLVGGFIVGHNARVRNADIKIAVRASGFLNFFKDRYFEKQRIFTNVDAAQILWTVIDETQSGSSDFYDTASATVDSANTDFGITQGTLDTIANKDRQYDFGKNVKDAIVQMTEVQSETGDFYFTYDKTFNFVDRQGSDKPQIVFSYPGNILEADFPEDAGNLANRIISVGSGQGENLVYSIDQDTGSQANYYLSQDWQQFSSIEEQATLSEHGEGLLQAEKDPLNIPDIRVDLNGAVSIEDFWVGDRVRIVEDSNAIPSETNGLFRIEELDLDVDENGHETAKLEITL